MKTLIVSGCSYTASEYISSAYPDMDTSWPKWPELLAEKLNMKLVNLAFSGAGNRFILQTLLEAIERTPKDEIGLVVAAWSQSNRDDWQEYKSNFKFNNERFVKGFKWQNTRTNRPGDVFSWVRETLLGYVTLQNVCKRYNIPYKQFQMIGLFESWLDGLKRTEREQLEGLPRYEYKGDKVKDKRELIKIIKEYKQFIDTDNVIGWPQTNDLTDKVCYPIFYSIVKNVVDKNVIDNIDNVIGVIDEHPNKQGQEKLARFVYDRLG